MILKKDLHLVEKFNEKFEEELARRREQDPQMPLVSVGYARYEGGSEALHAIIEKADAMMYRNKNMDDCVEMAEAAAEF